jgi:hypothetical protein
MADKAASVLARLKNKANETGRSYQLCLQLFCQEEFLRRLEKSKYAENFILKGGLFIYSLTGFESRSTVSSFPGSVGKLSFQMMMLESRNSRVTGHCLIRRKLKFCCEILAIRM